MRAIEQQMVCAIGARKNWTQDNTRVEVDGATARVYLFGNHIASVAYGVGPGAETLAVDLDTLRRFPTVTTQSRLRALGADVYTRRGVVYLDGRPI